MTHVWLISLGAYSDRRTVAVFDSEHAARAAAQALYRGQAPYPEAVELERFTVQSDPDAAVFDGGEDDGWEDIE